MVSSAGVILFLGGELASHTDPADSLGVFVGLFLIGLGWSFAMIAGSALLTGAFPAHERANVQGAADFTMVASGAAAGLVSGVIVEKSSFGSLEPLGRRRRSQPSGRSTVPPRHHREMKRGLAAGCAHRADTAFQRGDSLFEHSDSGVGEPRVEVPRISKLNSPAAWSLSSKTYDVVM